MNTQQKQFNETIFLFYKLKNQYEELIMNEKKKIIKIKELSWREKRRQFKRFKPKCINCKRTVGSIFSITRNPYIKSSKNEDENNEENIEKDEFSDARILKAYCGDRLNPCPLNIEIATNLFNIQKYLNEEETNLTNDKIEIIKYKNDLLFAYLNETDVINKFEELKEKIKSETSNYEFLLNAYNEIVNNKEKMDIITDNTREIYELIEKIRVTIDKYEKTDNIEYVNDAVNIYINELMPKIKDNNQIKYKINYVDFNEYDNTYNLVQLPYTTEDLEASLDNKVIHSTTGLANFRTK